MIKRVFVSLLVSLSFIDQAFASSMDHIHFLIPGGKSSGWDVTARQVGQAMVEAGIVKRTSFENLSGAGGMRATLELTKHPQQHQNTLMVHSIPIILRSVSENVDVGFRDVKPISLIMAEFQVVAVPINSEFSDLGALLKAISSFPSRFPVVGGSSRYSLDHITIALAMESYGSDPKRLRYIPSNGGGEALKRLLSGTGAALVTGYGEIVEALDNNQVKVLGVSSQNRLTGSDIPTFSEQGVNVVFSNWRGFFAPKDISDEQFSSYTSVLQDLNRSHYWGETRKKFGWSEFMLSGKPLLDFLEEQEVMSIRILRKIR